MTSKEYEQRLEALEQGIAALRQETVEDEPMPRPPHPRWRPILNETYYLIGRDASILSFCWDEGNIDTGLFAAANVYKSIDDAKFAVERWKVLAEMRMWAGNWNDPFAINMNADYILGVECLSYPNDSFGELRFATAGDALNCIKTVGEDRLIKYYFGVRDHEIPAETE